MGAQALVETRMGRVKIKPVDITFLASQDALEMM